ncbi:hypothetical protein [Xaviernesmea oryzae]|uniref:hypothetical protein n=1 Tax=Xaviernesmea oryzae TaxID=464029 RepID=UPI000A1935C7|nr:hypothetical protein [Xaviernesmea oryzae]
MTLRSATRMASIFVDAAEPQAQPGAAYRLLRQFPWLTFKQGQDIVPNHTECTNGIIVRELHAWRRQERNVLRQAFLSFSSIRCSAFARDYILLERKGVLESSNELSSVERKLVPAFM